jgi:hypothetical protein
MDARVQPGHDGPNVLLSSDTARAISILHARHNRGTRPDGHRAVPSVTLDRLDRALDELVAHPDRVGDPAKLADAAWGNAGKVVRARNAVTKTTADDLDDHAAPSVDHVDLLLFEVCDVIRRSSLGDRDRAIISMLIVGGDADDVAAVFRSSVTQSRVWVSRARRRARAAWLAAS